jgi:hypothetical protein
LFLARQSRIVSGYPHARNQPRRDMSARPIWYARSSFLRLTRAREYHVSSTDVNPAIAESVPPTERRRPWRSVARAGTVEHRWMSLQAL